MEKYTDPKKDNPYFCRIMRQAGTFCRIMRQAGTVAIMCPTMSLIASILFNVIMAGQPVWELPAIWVGTLLKNFPMAFFWNMFAAAPFTHWLFDLLFAKKNARAEAAAA